MTSASGCLLSVTLSPPLFTIDIGLYFYTVGVVEKFLVRLQSKPTIAVLVHRTSFPFCATLVLSVSVCLSIDSLPNRQYDLD